MKHHRAIVLGLSLFVLHLSLPSSSAEILVKSGEKIAFLGDSITGQGWGNPVGYVHLVIVGLEANGVKAGAVPAGVSGHRSDHMLARVKKDVIARKPQWMTLSCGVNDVWQRKGVPLDDAMAANGTYDADVASRGTFKKNITEIVDQVTAAQIKVVILTATGIKEQLDNKENTQLVAYNEFLRNLAQERKLPLADLNAAFQEKIKAANQPNKNTLTYDGVHMKAEGNKVMATGVLKAFGLNDAELAKANEAWTPMIAKDEAEHQAKAKAAADNRAKAAAAKKEEKKAPDAGAAKPAPPAK